MDTLAPTLVSSAPNKHTTYVALSVVHVIFQTLIFTFSDRRQPIVTGTSILGLKYKDGVMLVADTLGKLK